MVILACVCLINFSNCLLHPIMLMYNEDFCQSDDHQFICNIHNMFTTVPLFVDDYTLHILV